MDEQNIFSGIVICKDCGATMVLHRGHTIEKSQYNFTCRTYKKKGKEVCSAHFIKEVQLASVVLDDLRRATHYARQHESLFVDAIAKKNTKETQRDISLVIKELDTSSIYRKDCCW